MPHTCHWRSRAGALCLWAGSVMFALWAVPETYGLLYAHLELARFQASHAETRGWAPGRVAAYRREVRSVLPAADAVLRIPGAQMEVPVAEGTSDAVLNRGVGHLSGTGVSGTSENIVLAGHRDGFFRRLKFVSLGDRLEVVRQGATQVYRVDSLRVVEKHDLSPLRSTDRPTLTLVTCYPFFYLGAAPQRYVVQASLVSNPLQSKLQ